MERATDFYMRGFTARHYRDIRSLLEEYSGARHGANFFTKQDDIIYDILDWSLEVRSSISRFEGTNTVVFDDGTRADVDAIVWCTGYQPELPFLDEAFRDAGTGQSSGGFFDGQTLYKHVFHPRLGDSLAFIGFARPQIGAMPPIAELQARWFGAVLSGESALPGSSAMEEEAVADRSKFEAEKIFSGRLRSSVDFAKYTSDVAQKAGCYPDVGFQLLFSDPLLWQAFWLGPVLPQSYRIADAGARGETARAKMKEIYRTFLTRG
jgi:dimethylaniline monooxygenase (N-oxide forming)